MNRLLTDNILEQVKILASVPISQSRFSDVNLLLMLKDVLDTNIFPLIMEARSNHNEVKVTLTSDSDGYIDVPERAFMGGFNSLKNTSNNVFYNACPESSRDWAYNSYHFYQDSVIVSDASTQFEMTYTLRPPELLLESDAATVVSFNPTTRQVEVSQTLFSSDMDIIKPNGYARALNTIRTATTSGTVFPLDGTYTPVVGDFIVGAGKSPLVPIPQEMVGLVARVMVTRILMDIPDPEGAKSSMEIEKVMRAEVLASLKPRGGRSSIVSRKPFISNRNFRRGRI